MESLIQGLISLGLKRKEAQIYLALLQLGQGSAYSIARKSGLKRPTVYVILLELMKKGLVLKLLRRRQMFVPKPPSELVEMAEDRMYRAKNILPELQTLSTGQKKLTLLSFEDYSGVKQALYYRWTEMKGQTIHAFFGDSKNASPQMNTLFKRWNTDVYRNGGKIISLAPKSVSLKEFRKMDTRYGFLTKIISPKLYTSQCSIDITPLFVRFIFFGESQALIIENQEAGNALREVFQMVFRKY